MEIKSGKEKQTVYRPFGKWGWYVTDANNQLTVKCPDSIYSGEQDYKERYKIRVLKCLIHSIKTPVNDFKVNVEPKKVQS